MKHDLIELNRRMASAYDEVKARGASQEALAAVALGQQFIGFLARLKPEFVDDVLAAMCNRYERTGAF